MTADVVIVGGGVIGLSIAYRLAREGIAATVLDRGAVGREASWAGAGLIPPGSDRPAAGPTAALRSWSAALYPEWSAWLRDETGIDNGYRRNGGVDVALTADEERELKAMAGRWKVEGVVFERLAPADVRQVEPALGPAVIAAWFLPDRAQVRNPRHLRALELAAVRRGASMRPHAPALGFETAAGRVSAVRTATGRVPCGAVVVAAGAWSGELLATLGQSVPTPPVKGQIVLLRCDRPVLRRIVEHGPRYLVPRDDGRVLVGATEEDAGFDTRSTPAAVRDLIDEALRLCPGLERAEVETAWAGLRPGSLDTRPYLGPLPGLANAFVATGHRRSGLQLSTATAEVLVDLVVGRAPRLDLAPFRVDREAAAPESESFRS